MRHHVLAYTLFLGTALGNIAWGSLSESEDNSFSNSSYSYSPSTSAENSDHEEDFLPSDSDDSFFEAYEVRPKSQPSSVEDSGDDKGIDDSYLQHLQAVLGTQEACLAGVRQSEEGGDMVSHVVALATRSGYDPTLTHSLYDPFSLLGDLFHNLQTEESALPLIRFLNTHVLSQCTHYAHLCLVLDALKNTTLPVEKALATLEQLDLHDERQLLSLKEPLYSTPPLLKFLCIHQHIKDDLSVMTEQKHALIPAFKRWVNFNLTNSALNFWQFFPRIMRQQYGFRHFFLHDHSEELMKEIVSLCLRTGYTPTKQGEQDDPLYAMGYTFGCTSASDDARDLLISFLETHALPAFNHHTDVRMFFTYLGMLLNEDHMPMEDLPSLLAHLTPPSLSLHSDENSPMDFIRWRLEALTRYERPPISCTLYNPLAFLGWVNAYEQTNPQHFNTVQASLANQYLGFSFLLSHSRGSALLEKIIAQHVAELFDNPRGNIVEKLGILISFCDTQEQRDACVTLIEEKILPAYKDIARIHMAFDVLEDSLVNLLHSPHSDLSSSTETRSSSPHEQDALGVSFLTLLRGLTELRLSAQDLVLTPTLDAFCHAPAYRLACLQGLRGADDPDHLQTLLTPVPLIFCRTPEDLSLLISSFARIASPETQNEIHALIRTLPLKEGITIEIVTKLMDSLVAMESKKRQAAMTLLLDLVVPHSKVPLLYPDYLSWFENFLPENATDLKAHLTPSNVERISSPSDLTYFLSALAFKG